MVGKPILFCYDGSAHSRAAIERGVELIGDGRKAVVLHVTHPVSVSAEPIGTRSLAGSGANPEVVHAGTSASRAQNAMRVAEQIAVEGTHIARELGVATVEPIVRIADRHVWRTAVEVADEIDADALVVGSRGRGAIRGAVLGSVSSGLVHHCDRPVLVVRSSERAEP